MATINLGTASPTEGDLRQIDFKQATIQVQPVTLDTPSLTPATTPDENSPSEEVMAGKKIFSLERPTDKARELVKQLTLEEQVRSFLCRLPESLGPLKHWMCDWTKRHRWWGALYIHVRMADPKSISSVLGCQTLVYKFEVCNLSDGELPQLYLETTWMFSSA